MNQASPAVVQNNLFIDNSDINLILGSGSDSDVSGNVVFELQNGAFGGVMFDNFNGNTDGNFQGMQFHNNVIDCNGRCDFGLELGPHPWQARSFYPIESSNNVFCDRYPSANIIGGHVFANSIGGAACVSLVPRHCLAAHAFMQYTCQCRRRRNNRSSGCYREQHIGQCNPTHVFHLRQGVSGQRF